MIRNPANEDKARKIANRFKEICNMFDLVRFWTLTFHSELSYNEHMYKWNAFVTSLRDLYPKLQYLGVKEYHPGTGENNGTIHFHVLFDRYVEWQVVQRLWERLGCGKVVRVDRIPTKQVATYVCKYITKTIESGEVKRPVISSRKFCLHLSNFLKWTEKLCSWGRTYLLKWVIDNLEVKEYTSIASLRKRKQLYKLRNIALALGL